MKKTLLFTFILLTCLTATKPVWARAADMFDELRLTNKRPWVPSDGRRGQEMVQVVPHLYHKNADMLRVVGVNRVSLNEDMISAPRPRSIPYESSIFTNDSWTN